MKLKSVELIGFKSFAKKTKINFPSGITEIVGPNGSGKSNIIEAIRWALGEQSAKNLRSSRMTDVIFSGSQSHPALNRAKVTLIFDNSDHFINVNYTEIKISRIVFRDGTNNYYLNGKPCRLRDIQVLFMNTGIGNGSFSIISQGKVAQIFKSKPVDRRFIIETVAGIYKYRSQKENAAKKLAHVDDNLTRVNDLNYELKHRLLGLGKERHAAQQYLKCKRLANRLDIRRLLIRFNQLKRKQRILRQHNNRVSIKFRQLNQQIGRLRNKNQVVHQRLSRSLKNYNQVQEMILNRSQRLDNLTNQNSLKRQKLSFWRKQISRYQGDLAKNYQRINRLDTERNSLKTQKQRVAHKVNYVTKFINQVNLKRHPHLAGSRQDRMVRLRNEYVSLIKREAKIKGQIEYQRQDHHQQKIQMTRFHSQLINVKKLIHQCRSKIKDIDAELSNVKQFIIQDQNRLSKQQILYRQQARKFKLIKKRYHEATRKDQILQIKLNGLKRINDRHSNLYNGTRNLLNQQTRFTGIFGTVAKFIDVPTLYIRAIEVTLRSQLQYIIVNDSETAKAIVRFMSAGHLGRVTLLPMNSISRRWINPGVIHQCQQIQGFINVASNLVKMPNHFLNVKLHLLGNVIIAKDISSAIQISRIIHRRYRVVTLNGDVVNAGGAITGGHGRYRYHGLLSQKAKTEQYQKLVSELTEEIKRDKDTGITTSNQLISIKQVIQSVQKHLEQCRQNQVIRDNVKTRLLDEINNYRKILSHHQKSINSDVDNPNSVKQLSNDLAKVKRQLSRSHQHLVAEQELNHHQTMVTKRYDKQYQGYRETLIKLQGQNEQLDNNVAVNLKTLDQVHRAVTKANHNVNDFTQTIKSQSRQIRSNARLNQLSKKIDQLTAKKARFHRLVVQDQQSGSQLKPRLSKDQTRLMNLRDQSNQNRLTKQDLSRRIREVTEVLFRKYQIDVTKERISEPKVSLYQISSKLFRVQKRLRRIGPVNVNSISQFKKVNYRYRFLSKQVNDLVTSKDQLLTTMNQMDSKIKVRFKDTFDQVNRAFKITYSQIFKGGRAKLTLLDPKHLLTTGINIMAQPPGKRYRNMELLSGGERALTAIALLFAILRIKPAPFCILDEAESALDAVNIDRFGEYMKKLEVKTQFIVITHRKTTMLYADNLYGVTMQNSGISKIISVNLRKVKTEG